MTHVDYLIIGGGIAGTTAAEQIRKRKSDATIVIVSRELHSLYSRVLLPHYILGKIKRNFVFLKKDAWYTEHAIVLVRGRTLTALAVASHEATLDDGTVYHYKKILLATGGEAERLELPMLSGITYFRTLDDADEIIRATAAAVETQELDRTAVIYGGGFIALEYAPIFRKAELVTHLAMRGDRMWSNQLDEISSSVLEKNLIDQDIHLHRRCGYVKVAGSGTLLSVDISGTQLSARVLGIGIGLRTNMHAIKHAGIECNQGIRTNEFLETNAPDVYAAGDIAEFFDRTVNRHRLIGTWMNAQHHGMCVAATMMGERTASELVTSYSTSPFGQSITFIGDVLRTPETQVIIRSATEKNAAGQIFLRDGRVVGATLINMNPERTPLTTLIRSQIEIRGKEAVFGDPASNLSTLL